MRNLSIILIVLFTISITSYANELYSIVKVNYKIFVNNTSLESDLPILNYNGNTYVPLRKVSEALGANVEWYQTDKTIRINMPSSPKACKVFYKYNDQQQIEIKDFNFKYYTKNNESTINREFMLSPISWIAFMNSKDGEMSINGDKITLKIRNDPDSYDSDVVFTIGSNQCIVNGKSVNMDIPVEKVGSDIYFPIKQYLEIKHNYIRKHPGIFRQVPVIESKGNILVYEQLLTVD